MIPTKSYDALARIWSYAIENDDRRGKFSADGPNFYIAYNAPKDTFEVYPACIYPEPMLPAFSSEDLARKCIYTLNEALKPIFI